VTSRAAAAASEKPQRLENVLVRNCAWHCHRAMAEAITQGGDYVLAMKGNQPALVLLV